MPLVFPRGVLRGAFGWWVPQLLRLPGWLLRAGCFRCSSRPWQGAVVCPGLFIFRGEGTGRIDIDAVTFLKKQSGQKGSISRETAQLTCL